MLIGGTETAWFAAPLRILLALLAFGFLYHFNIYPMSARLLSDDRTEWAQLMRASVRVTAWSGIAIALILTLLSRPLMMLIFGEKFIASVPVFSILIWILPIRLLADHARWTLVAASLQRYLLFAEMAGAVVLVASGLVLAPVAASKGAALAAIIGNLTTWATAHLFVVRRIGRLPSFRVSLSPALAALCCVILSSLIHSGGVLSVIVPTIAYCVCACLVSDVIVDIKRLAYSKNWVKDRS
jgi:O-antigen/teichoic acid export membrane protein